MELAEFCYNNLEHSTIGSTPFRMVMGKSPIVPITWAALGQPPSDASEEVSMVTQFDEERRRLSTKSFYHLCAFLWRSTHKVVAFVESFPTVCRTPLARKEIGAILDF